jgi:hypothetical protein
VGDYNTAQRAKLESKGQALPGRRFPIKDKVDLQKAIRLAGHAKDSARVKAFIKKRAAALGASDMIPDGW